MSAAAAARTGPAPHLPVLLDPVLDALEPVAGGVFVDGTYGAGGYSRGLLDRGAERVVAIDRDPEALAGAERQPRLTLVEGTFDRLDAVAAAEGAAELDGVTLDIGVSSMQLDRAERGFSFQRPGPLDMRMGGEGPTAADIVNGASAETLADILHRYGEERAARRIARAVVEARAEAPVKTTTALAEIVAGCLPRPKPGQIHPATRTFQALRIAVNDELGQLVRGLSAAERALKPGGRLAVVTFHSLEDRIVKRYLADAASAGGGGSRHLPAAAARRPRFERPEKPVTAGEGEL
ncbi:MAG TPA: 16S rRNA (cytosine(1402)-N(4))-methyltransferase RsmH, partial [Thermohalobaculum sp.]|nr:16S rRNA (cytosine(1402)-N(4))-methyltransferase RsmH [Thermohalobaculum sp.]